MTALQRAVAIAAGAAGLVFVAWMGLLSVLLFEHATSGPWPCP
jgi:hypothetical protein